MFDAVGPARPLVDGLATPGLFWLDLRPAGLLLMLSPMPSCQRSDDTPRPCLRCSRAYRLTAPRADHHGKAHQSHHMQQILSPRLALFRRCFLHEPRVTGGARRLRCPRRLLCLCVRRDAVRAYRSSNTSCSACPILRVGCRTVSSATAQLMESCPWKRLAGERSFSSRPVAHSI